MRVRNAKKTIMILLSVVLTLFFAVSLTFLIKTHYDSQASNQTIIDPNMGEYDGGGGGTVTKTVYISTAEELIEFADAVDSSTETYPYSGDTVKLTQNIDMKGKTFHPIGSNEKGEQASGQQRMFFGTFDGCGYTISNILIDRPAGIHYNTGVDGYGLGLFAVVRGTVKNVKIKNMTIYPEGSSGYQYIGGITGVLTYGEIENCEVEGLNIISTSSTDLKWTYKMYGGIAGGTGDYQNLSYYDDSTITNCKVSNFKINIFQNSSNDVRQHIGGIVGYFSPKTAIINCILDTRNNLCEFENNKPDNNNTNQITDKLENWDPCTITNCYMKAKTTTGLDVSSVTGSSESTIWYYHENYNGGWPCLRQFMSWTQYTVNVGNETGNYGGYLKRNGTDYTSAVTIYSPSDFDTTTNLRTVRFPEEVISYSKTDPSSSAYEFVQWTKSGNTYTPIYKMKEVKLTFNNVYNVESGDSAISPTSESFSSGTSFIVHYGATITPNKTAGEEGPFNLVYTIKDVNFTDTPEYTVTYSIPEKYKLTFMGSPIVWDMDTTTAPSVAKRTFVVTLNSAGNSSFVNGCTWSVEYGDSVTSSVDLTNNTLQFTSPSNTTITYTPNEGYKLEKVEITVGTTKTTITDLTKLETNLKSTLTTITNNITIQPYYARWYNVTFKAIGNTTQPTADTTVSVKSGTAVTWKLSTNGKTLAFYNGSKMIASYYAKQYYIMNDYSNADLSKVQKDLTITPSTQFYACTVTMGEIDSSYGTRVVTGDNYGTANDGVFVVEYNTTVTFSISTDSSVAEGNPVKFIYTYTFSSGQVVTYTITNDQYAMQYELNNEGNRTRILNGFGEEFDAVSSGAVTDTTINYTFSKGSTTKEISPEFGNKQYYGELA